MFNWTTTTIVNELPQIFDEGNGVRIANKLFEKRWVESIRKAEGKTVELCKTTLNMSTVETAMGDAQIARLYIYVGLEGSEESIYANDWYRKGMPLSVSFAKDTAANMATAIADTIKKFNVFTKVKKILDVTASGSNLVIEGTHEHQRIQKIAILVNDATSLVGEEKVVLEWTLQDARYNNKLTTEYHGVTVNKEGRNGFGTYSQLIKDLRLPTGLHTNWSSVQKDEMPIVGALYTQYIINYYAPSTANPSFTAVGNRSMSETTHVFWVKSDLVDNWETAIAGIDPDATGFKTITNSFVTGTYSNKSEAAKANEIFDEVKDETGGEG
jgi:hypothetical protein